MQSIRRTYRPVFPVAAALTVAVLGAGCGEDPVDPPPPVPTTITISPETATLESVGETVQLAATVHDQHGAVMTGVAVNWSSRDPSVVTVSSGGLVTAEGNGTTAVEASAGDAVASAAMTTKQRPAEVRVSPSAETLVALGDTVRLSAEVLDANGHAIQGAEFTWASGDESVATVDGTGLVIAVSNGSASVTAAIEDVSGSAEVVVEQQPAEVRVTPPADTLVALGDTVRLLAEALDANGHLVVGTQFAWASSDESVLTVDGTGLVTAAGNGTTTVSATVGGISGAAHINVEQRPAGLKIVSGNGQEGIKGYPLLQPLAVRVEDERGSAVAEIPVTFSPGDESGTVSPHTAVTDSDGRASTEWTLGSGRTQSVAVSAGGDLAARFSAQLVSGPYQCGTATRPANVPELPLRAIHASGYWGTNEQVVEEWEGTGSGPLVPPDYLDWLKSLHANWIGISVHLFIDDSMDSSVQRTDPVLGAFSDLALRQFIRDFRAEDINVYVTLAITDEAAAAAERPVRRWQLGDPGDPGQGVLPEHWPWRADHPDHENFVSEFWESYTRQAVHFAGIAQEEGARMFSLGTETDRLFRTRAGEHATHFGEELGSMVDQVRAVYDGALTYDMHYDVFRAPDYYGPGSFCLWEDLDLDVIGISAWFNLTDASPSSVVSTARLEMAYDRIFREYLIPLSNDNPERPVVFLEYGAMDVVAAPHDPANTSDQGKPFVFVDANGNGVDDGRETQANIYQAVLNTMAAHPGAVNGLFFWDNWMASNELWSEWWANHRNFDIRGKSAEAVIRAAYASFRR